MQSSSRVSRSSGALDRAAAWTRLDFESLTRNIYARQSELPPICTDRTEGPRLRNAFTTAERPWRNNGKRALATYPLESCDRWLLTNRRLHTETGSGSLHRYEGEWWAGGRLSGLPVDRQTHSERARWRSRPAPGGSARSHRYAARTSISRSAPRCYNTRGSAPPVRRDLRQ